MNRKWKNSECFHRDGVGMVTKNGEGIVGEDSGRRPARIYLAVNRRRRRRRRRVSAEDPEDGESAICLARVEP